MTEKRLLILYCAIFAFAFIVEIKMVSLITDDYAYLAEKQTVHSVDISTGRADIADCNLNNITGTENRFRTFITNETDLQNIYEYIREEDRPRFYRQVQQQRQAVVELTAPLQSEQIYTTSKRYSSANIAQHLIGYTDLAGDGVTGIEKAYNTSLKNNGEKITVSFNVNGNGDIYGDITPQITGNRQVLSLTIDNALQRLREGIAKENIPNGSVIIMECATGKIKAMASTPVYDANNVVEYLDDDNSPMVNKALQSYEPGSVIKPLWAAALLEQGMNKDKIYYCNGYTTVNGHTYHCANNRAHGPLDLQQALVVSCNCYFIDRYVKNKGFVFSQMANQLDFGTQLQLCDSYYTSAGNFPTAEQTENMGVQSSICFGQGNFRLTPVHVASYMNIFATGGLYVSPQIIEGIYDKTTEKQLEKLYNFNCKRVIGKETADTVKNMLIQVTEKGASRNAKPTFLSAGGKTGTAQTGKIKENGEELFTAWYCGFYPADKPLYTICVTIYDGGESSYSAAPVFKKICDSIYYLKYADGIQ